MYYTDNFQDEPLKTREEVKAEDLKLSREAARSARFESAFAEVFGAPYNEVKIVNGKVSNG